MLGVHVVFRRRLPDMIISGINHGGNMGDDVTYSGTVAAAIEGAILKVPSIAVSMADFVPDASMAEAALCVSRLVDQYDTLGLDPSIFLNVNIPVRSRFRYRRFLFTSQGLRRYKDVVIHKTDPRGKAYYWIAGRPQWTTKAGSDFAAVKAGYVSITPMKLDFTDETMLARLNQNGDWSRCLASQSRRSSRAAKRP
jgi:5'-nucleotidase